MMFDLQCTGSDSTAIWLSYKGIEDRQEVLKVLTEARATVPDNKVWDDLVAEVMTPA